MTRQPKAKMGTNAITKEILLELIPDSRNPNDIIELLLGYINDWEVRQEVDRWEIDYVGGGL